MYAELFQLSGKNGMVEQKFKGGKFIKRPRWMLDTEGKIVEGSENANEQVPAL